MLRGRFRHRFADFFAALRSDEDSDREILAEFLEASSRI